jgi:hypothetical protein
MRLNTPSVSNRSLYPSDTLLAYGNGCSSLQSKILPATLLALTLSVACSAFGQVATPPVPDWAQPGSATHKQVPPPAGFHRPTTTVNTPIGIFDGQSDVGSAVVPGSASYDPAMKAYTIHSAGYNIWYTRDEFRFLWKKMSGDVSLAADATFPDPNGYNDRKVVLILRQSLDDDSKEAMIGEHGTGHDPPRPARRKRRHDHRHAVSLWWRPQRRPR